MVRRLGLSCAILLVLGTFEAVDAQGKKSDSEVKVTATATKPDSSGKQLVTVSLVHNKGWHTYANPIGNEELDPNKTLVTVKAKGSPLAANVEYPMGKLTKDKIVGDYKVYENKIDIRATVQRAQGDNSPLEIDVRITACNEKTCLLPATVKVTVP